MAEVNKVDASLPADPDAGLSEEERKKKVSCFPSINSGR